jgi:hypothetical protein
MSLTERSINMHRAGCSGGSSGLGVVICVNGSRQVRSWCLQCKAYSTNYAKRELVAAGINVDLLPVVRDHRDDVRPSEPCVVCTSQDEIEYHHFAPVALQAFFRRSVWDWPVLPLCKECHREWHRAVTPDLVLTQVKLGELGARRSMTLRELLDGARQAFGTLRRKSA